MDLELTLGEPITPLSAELAGRWGSIIAAAKGSPYTPPHGLILLATVLEILDGGAHCSMNCRKFDEGTVYGKEHDWELATANIRLQRVFKSDLSESWSRIEVETDTVNFSGLPPGVTIQWDGELPRNFTDMKLKITGIDEKTAQEIYRSAQSLFNRTEKDLVQQ